MLYIGQMLYWYCGGYFGRDSYDDKRIEALGVDWVVARETNGEVVFCSGENIHEKLSEYTTPPKNVEGY